MKLRDVEYAFADLTVEVRTAREREYATLMKDLILREKGIADGDGNIPEPPTDDEWRKFKRQGVALALEGVPIEVAESLTESEFEALRTAFADYREVEIHVEGKEKAVAPPDSKDETQQK